ncbi:dual specificity testis-specific protein kinase 2-like [Ptychodera flava]|uniref:dual specificity testis-specific protein kinase 2-like n=1 Tax=Ptychodera flava TaxID=63121 RepID=UPI00396A188F
MPGKQKIDMNRVDSDSVSCSTPHLVNGNKENEPDPDGPWNTNDYGDPVFASTPTDASGDQAPLPLCYRRQGASFKALKTAVKNLASMDDFVSEKLGSGFFSDVYKVTHRQNNQVMVLKMNTLSSNRHNVLGEVQLLNRLSHPNILRFMGVCVHEGKLNALTEFCNSGNLEDLLSSDTKLDWDLRLHLALDIGEGMKYLHSKGVIHRDLTSMNCLIKKQEDDRYRAVVGDFGLACKIPKDNDPKLHVVGSPFWMAPECLKGHPYNERVDLFSFGIILCEIIARIPADPDYLPRLENFGLDVAAFSTMCGDCPNDFLQLAIQLCSREPAERPTFAETVDLINNIIATQQLREDLMDVVLADREKEALKSPGFKGHKRAKSASGTPSPPLSR